MYGKEVTFKHFSPSPTNKRFNIIVIAFHVHISLRPEEYDRYSIVICLAVMSGRLVWNLKSIYHANCVGIHEVFSSKKSSCLNPLWLLCSFELACGK